MKKTLNDSGNCLCCGEAGHRTAECVHAEIGCEFCGQKGHIKATCRKAAAALEA
jgi:hypothetical protein